MRYETSVEIDASPENVWTVLVDVERWPAWTASMTSVRLLRPEPFMVGSAARIKQPKLPPAVWRVTDFQPGRSFSWVAKGPGVATTASHTVTARDGGDGAVVTLGLVQGGPLAPIADLLLTRLTRRYMRIEATGLKRRCEPQDS